MQEHSEDTCLNAHAIRLTARCFLSLFRGFIDAPPKNRDKVSIDAQN